MYQSQFSIWTCKKSGAIRIFHGKLCAGTIRCQKNNNTLQERKTKQRERKPQSTMKQEGTASDGSPEENQKKTKTTINLCGNTVGLNGGWGKQ